MPGPGHKGDSPVPGYEARLASRLPALLSPHQAERDAVANTRRWLGHGAKPFAAAWRKSCEERAFPEWAAQLREMWWTVHMSANQGLFDIGDAKWLADLLGVSVGALLDAHYQSCMPDVVRRWSRGQGGDVAELAGQAYLASILLREKSSGSE